jgi:O-antigen ligase/tetratricopeptide (TPR) repeat protein
MMQRPVAGLALVGLHLLLAPLVFSIFSVEAFEFPKSLMLRGTCIALLALAAGRLILRRVSGPPASTGVRGWVRRGDPIVWGVLAFLVSASLSTAVSISPRTSLLGAHHRFAGLATLSGYAVLFFATRAWVRSPADVRVLLWAVLAGSAGSAFWAAVQAAGLDPIVWDQIKRFRGFERVSSTLGNPNFLGAYLAAAFPAAAFLALHSWRARRWGAAAFAASVLALGVGATAATLSRGAWAALGAAAVVLAVGWLRAGERLGVRALAVGAIVLAAAGGLLAQTEAGASLAENAVRRLALSASPETDLRTEFWMSAADMFADRPWLGVGVDAFQLAHPLQGSPSAWRLPLDRIPSHAHNEPLQVAATQGVVGLAIGAGVTAISVQCLFSFTVIALGALLVTYLGIASRFATQPPSARSAARLAPTHLALLLAGGGLAASAGFALNGFAATTPWDRGVLATSAGLLGTLLACAMAAFRSEVAGPSAGGVQRPGGAPARAAPGHPPRIWRAILAWTGLGAAATAALYLTVYVPYIADAFCRRGRSLVEADQYAEAIPFLQEAARLEPGRELFWIDLGVAHHRAAFSSARTPERRTFHLEQALRAHARAAKLVPINGLNRANVGRALTDLARHDPRRATREEALGAFDASLALAPSNPLYLEDASKAALLLGELEAAEAYARRSLGLYPQHAQARALLAAVAMQRADWASAAVELAAASRADWRSDRAAEAAAWANLATVHLERDRPEDALKAAEEALARLPENAFALRSKARAHELLAARAAAAGRAAQGEELRELQRRLEEHRARAAEARGRALSLDRREHGTGAARDPSLVRSVPSGPEPTRSARPSRSAE